MISWSSCVLHSTVPGTISIYISLVETNEILVFFCTLTVNFQVQYLSIYLIRTDKVLAFSCTTQYSSMNNIYVRTELDLQII